MVRPRDPANDGPLSPHLQKHFNFRLAPEEASDELTGYVKNGVTPVAMAHPVPIVVSHRIGCVTGLSVSVDRPFNRRGLDEVHCVEGSHRVEWCNHHRVGVCFHCRKLLPSFFFLGGGHIDLKLGVDFDQFVKAYDANVADVTYDDGVADLDS